MKDNYKIAVMLSGHPKNLDVTQHLFKHWNNLYDDIHFDFFISIWETINNEYEKVSKTLTEDDLSWATKVEFIKEDDCPYDLKSHTPGEHQPHYTYSFKKVNELRNSYDEEYDAILTTRCDIFLFRELIDGLVYELKGKRNEEDSYNPQLTDRNIFTNDGVRIYTHKNSKGEYHKYLWTQDYFFFGTPKVMDIFSNMFDDMYIHKKYNGSTLMHVFQAEYLYNQNILNMGLQFSGQQVLVREPYRFKEQDGDVVQDGNRTIKHIVHFTWHKKNPTPNQLLNLIDEKGIDWILDKGREINIINYFQNTPKE